MDSLYNTSQVLMVWFIIWTCAIVVAFLDSLSSSFVLLGFIATGESQVAEQLTVDGC